MKLKLTVGTLIGLAIMNGCGGSSTENEELSGGTLNEGRNVDRISMAYQEGDRSAFDLNFTKVSEESVKLVFGPVIGNAVTLLTATGKGTFLLSCMPLADTMDGKVKIECDGIGPDENGDTVNVSYTMYPERDMVHLVKAKYNTTPTYGEVAYEFTAEEMLLVKITER